MNIFAIANENIAAAHPNVALSVTCQYSSSSCCQ